MSEIIISEEMMDEVNKLIDLDEDELFTLLGAQISALETPTNLLMSSQSNTEEKNKQDNKKGRISYNLLEEKLKKIICDDWEYCKKKEKYNENLDTINDLMPFVIGGFGLIEVGVMAGFPMLLSVIVIKRGINEFCNCD